MLLTILFSVFQSQISEMKSSSANSAVRNLLLDPAVNFVIEKLKRELCDTKAKLEETQSELSAWKFTPDRCAHRSTPLRRALRLTFAAAGVCGAPPRRPRAVAAGAGVTRRASRFPASPRCGRPLTDTAGDRQGPHHDCDGG